MLKCSELGDDVDRTSFFALLVHNRMHRVHLVVESDLQHLEVILLQNGLYVCSLLLSQLAAEPLDELRLQQPQEGVPRHPDLRELLRLGQVEQLLSFDHFLNRASPRRATRRLADAQLLKRGIDLPSVSKLDHR